MADGGPDAVAIVVATPEHRAMFTEALGEVRLLDAATLLGQFSDGGVLDASAFHEYVGRLVRDAGAAGHPVRVFGEMVALLWAQGLVAQAIELESFWTGLAETVPFSLLCAYPSSLVLDHDEPGHVNEVCDAHHGHALRAFAPSPHSIAEARRFVSSRASVAASAQLEKLLLIVSELATNAVRHAATPFVVEVATEFGGVRVSVRDRCKTEIGATTAPMESECGRGLGLVDALADAWGVRGTAHGKVVWAEVV